MKGSIETDIERWQQRKGDLGQFSYLLAFCLLFVICLFVCLNEDY